MAGGTPVPVPAEAPGEAVGAPEAAADLGMAPVVKSYPQASQKRTSGADGAPQCGHTDAPAPDAGAAEAPPGSADAAGAAPEAAPEAAPDAAPAEAADPATDAPLPEPDATIGAPQVSQ
jgi:hypothetical protein